MVLIQYSHLHKEGQKIIKNVQLSQIFLKTFHNFPQQTFVLMKTSWRCLEDVFRLRLQKTSSRCLDQDQYNGLRHTSSRRFPFSRRLQNIFETSSRCLEKRLQYIFKTSCNDIFKNFPRRIIKLKCSCSHVFKMSSRHIQNVSETYRKDSYLQKDLPRSHFWEISKNDKSFSSFSFYFTTLFSACFQNRI